jgi:hypothetical protein
MAAPAMAPMTVATVWPWPPPIVEPSAPPSTPPMTMPVS